MTFGQLIKRLFGKSESFRRREIIQPPKVNDSQKELAYWITRQIRRLDNDRWHLLNALEEKIEKEDEGCTRKINRLEAEIQTLSRMRSAEKSITSLMYKKDGQEPTVHSISPLEETFNNLVQKVLDKRIMRARLSTLAVVGVIGGIVLGGVYYIVKTKSYDRNQEEVKSVQEEQANSISDLEKASRNNGQRIGEISNYARLVYDNALKEISYSEDKIRRAFSGVISNKDERIGILANNNLQLLEHVDYLEGIISEQQEQSDFYFSDYTQKLARDSADKARIEKVVSELSNQLFRTDQKYSALIDKLNNLSGQNVGINGRLETLERQRGVYPLVEDSLKTNLPLRLRSYTTE